jgi:hypothetical protein
MFLGLFLLHVPQCNFRSVHLLVVAYHRTNYGLRSPLSTICRNVNLHSHNVEFYNIVMNQVGNFTNIHNEK